MNVVYFEKTLQDLVFILLMLKYLSFVMKCYLYTSIADIIKKYLTDTHYFTTRIF